jgi:hypothetical protein
VSLWEERVKRQVDLLLGCLAVILAWRNRCRPGRPFMAFGEQGFASQIELE